MPTAAERISDEVLALPSEARLALVDKILTSLNLPTQPEIDRLWMEEVKRRVGEMERGETDLVPGEEVFDRIRRKYAR